MHVHRTEPAVTIGCSCRTRRSVVVPPGSDIAAVCPPSHATSKYSPSGAGTENVPLIPVIRTTAWSASGRPENASMGTAATNALVGWPSRVTVPVTVPAYAGV
ncbi:MAG: hypothetical protein V1685_03030 [Parcubacteria group bacterium]